MIKYLLPIIFLSCTDIYFKPFYISCEKIDIKDFIQYNLINSIEQLECESDIQEVKYWEGVCDTLEAMKYFVDTQERINQL